MPKLLSRRDTPCRSGAGCRESRDHYGVPSWVEGCLSWENRERVVDMAMVRGRVAGIAVAGAGGAGLVPQWVRRGGPAAAPARAKAPATTASAGQAKSFSNPVLGPGQDP